MSDNNTVSRDYIAEVRAAVEKLRSFAAGRESDITGAIDKVADFVDTQTKGRFSSQIDKAQAVAKSGVHGLVTPNSSGPHDAPSATDAAWNQPPAGQQFADTSAQEAATEQAQKLDLNAQVEKLRGFAADHKDDIEGLVDKIGDFVDRATGGKYAAQVDKVQSRAKDELNKRLPGDESFDPTI